MVCFVLESREVTSKMRLKFPKLGHFLPCGLLSSAIVIFRRVQGIYRILSNAQIVLYLDPVAVYRALSVSLKLLNYQFL